MAALAVSTLLFAASLASAHPGCSGQELINRNVGGPLVRRDGTVVPRGALGRRQTTMTEASEAQILDIGTECTIYSYEPVVEIESEYPPGWTIATIVSGDTEATDLFATINATVNAALPNDVPHGTSAGNFTGVSYNSTDPDCWWSWNKCTTPAASTGLAADISTVPEPMTWGFGFDDGPNCSHNALYDFLQQENQLATMFYIGSNVLDWSLQALRGVADGHQICVHTWSHRYMTALTNDEVFAELYYTRKLLKAVLGITPKCWRPPYGDVDNRVRMIAANLNLTTIIWSDDTSDWKEAAGDGVTPEDVNLNYQAIINKTMNGTYTSHGPIVLNHELTNYTMQEMMNYYPSIKAAFNHIVPITVALNETTPYVETNYTFPDFATYVAARANSSSSSSTSSSSSSSSASSSGSGASTTTGSNAATSSKASGSTTGIAFPAVLLVGGLVFSLL